MEGRMSIKRICAPELTFPGMSPCVTDSTCPTRAKDMYAFGVMAFEVGINFEWQYFLALLTRDRFSRDALRFQS